MKKELLEKGYLSPIDFYFAESLSEDEEVILFLAVLLFFSREGHICMKVTQQEIIPSLAPFKEYQTELEKILQKGSQKLFPLCQEEKLPIVCQNSSYYLEKNWKAERRFIENIQRLLTYVVTPLGGAFEGESLAPLQKEAVHKGLTHTLSIITGGPGTGKTYTAAGLVNAFIKASSSVPKIILTAPTGKAASRLEASIRKHIPQEHPFIAGTLHSLLEIYNSRDFESKEGLLFADLIIVDECSMIDARLFAYFLSSIRKGTRLILMGDPFQLASVEGGSFFSDLIDSLPSLTTHLTHNFRAEENSLKTLASTLLGNDLEKSKRELAAFALEEEVHFGTIIDRIKTFYPPPAFSLADPEVTLHLMENFRILSSLRQGAQGVDNLNKKIVETFFSEMEIGAWLSLPILITRNNYELGLYNGQTGIICRKKVEPKMELHLFSEEEVAYFPGGKKILATMLPAFEYAYCISVHKAQGSEYERVLLLIPPGSEVFGKEVLYTAVTRAKKSLEIEMNEKIIEETLKKSTERGSGIAAHFQEMKFSLERE